MIIFHERDNQKLIKENLELRKNKEKLQNIH